MARHLGSARLTRGENENTVTGGNIITHPSFSPGGDFDIGVLKVSTPPPGGAFFANLDPTPASIGKIAICGYASDAGDDNKQHVDVDFLRTVSDNLERADYNASTMPGTSGSPVFYTLTDSGQTTDIGVVGVHVSSAAIHSSGQDPLYNSCVRLTDAKLNWIWSL